ncbi:serine/threonine-protein kinase [Streptomyces sp. MCAF7]
MTGYDRSGEGLAPGGRVGPYRILSVVADGGTGRVYLARSSPGGRLAALRTIRAEGPVGDAARQRFAHEVTLARRVAGIYTANVVDADPAAEVPWLATEYIAAPSLAHLVETCGPLPVRAVRWVAAGVAEALVNVHAAGLVHPDLNPSHVLLPEGGPRVIDFGVPYSPEQARGEECGAASDVFSLGATMFYLAVGRPSYAAVWRPIRPTGPRRGNCSGSWPPSWTSRPRPRPRPRMTRPGCRRVGCGPSTPSGSAVRPPPRSPVKQRGRRRPTSSRTYGPRRCGRPRWRSPRSSWASVSWRRC